MIKSNCKGKILKGYCSPRGQVEFEDDTEETSGYYVYIWPKDGTNWPDSNDEMIYDHWLENLYQLEEFIKDREWEIKWQEGAEK